MSVEFTTPIGTFKTGTHDWDAMLMHDRAVRITRLIEERGMTVTAAATVVDAAMFGIGCIEGRVRAEIQKRLDEKR